MREEWTARVVYGMHYYGITAYELANKSGYTATYISMVLNCKKKFKDESSKLKTQNRIMLALEELKREREG